MAFSNDRHIALIDGGTSSIKMALGYQKTPVKMYIPTGFAGATVTFNVADDFNGNWGQLRKSSADEAVSYSVTAGNWYILEPKDFAGIENLQIVSASIETEKEIVVLTGKL